MSESKGLRYNKGKLRWSLLQWKALVEVLKVTEMGAEKYSPRNWEKGLSYSETYDSAQRHLVKWYLKEDNDEESKLSHLAHAAWNCLTLLEFELNRESYKSFDDRGKEVIKSVETKFVNSLVEKAVQLNKQLAEQIFTDAKINNIFNLRGVEYKISGPKLFAGSMTPCYCEICRHEIRREENVVELHGGESRKFLHNRCLEAHEKCFGEYDLNTPLEATSNDYITINGETYMCSIKMRVNELSSKQSRRACLFCLQGFRADDHIIRLISSISRNNDRMIHAACLTLDNLIKIKAAGSLAVKYKIVDDNDLGGLC